MVNRSPNVTGIRSKISQENSDPAQPGNDCGADLGGGAERQCRRGLPTREHRADVVLSLEAEVQGGWNSEPPEHEARSQGEGLRKRETRTRSVSPEGGTVRIIDRTTASEKKREFGLIGDLRGRHLSAPVRAATILSLSLI